jgi:hypothetical protein
VAAVHESWVIRHANGRTVEILGISDLDAFIGSQFWDHFTPKSTLTGHPSQCFLPQLLEGLDFSVEVRAFTDEGRKVWLTCTFRSGTMSQVLLQSDFPLYSDELPPIPHFRPPFSACKGYICDSYLYLVCQGLFRSSAS